MKDTAVKDLLRQALTAEEPPVSPHIIGGAVRSARRTRRRQAAGAVVAVVAIVFGLAFGVPAITHALGPRAGAGHGLGTSPLAGGAPKSHAVKPKAPRKTAPGPHFAFLRPKLPKPVPEINPVAITNQSVGELLLVDLPAKARPSQIEASNDANPTASMATADAWLNDVRTAHGSGNLQVNMLGAGSKPFDFGCGTGAGAGTAADPTCRLYKLPHGIEVEEEYQAGTTTSGQHFVQLMVAVFRPNTAELAVIEGDSAMAAGSPITKGMPLKIAQMLKIALDSRWQFSISESFVQQASGLYVAPLDTSGS